MENARPAIKGNGYVLAGAILYLLEWAAIIPAGDSGPSDPGTAAGKVLGLYTAHPTAVAFLAAWLSVVLIGRVLIVLGIRSALRSVGADDTLVLFAAAAMTLSVVLEVVSEAMVFAGTVFAQRSQDDLVHTFDTVAGVTWTMVFGPLGLAVGLAAWSMLRSRAFPTWICAAGLLGGALLVLGGIAGGPGYLHSGTARGIQAAGLIGVPVFWLWMLATGIFLVRRVRRPAPG